MIASTLKKYVIPGLLAAIMVLTAVPSPAINAADDTEYGWIKMESGVTADLYAVWGFADNDVYAVGADGTVLHYDGLEWSPLKPPSTNDLNDVWGASPDDLYVVGDNATILMYDGQGDWDTKQLKNNEVNLYGVCGYEDKRYIVGWDDGSSLKDQIVHYNGYKWLYLNPVSQMYMSDVWATPNGCFASGSENRIMEYDGLWNAWKLGGTQQLYDIWGDSESDIFAVGGLGTCYHWNGTTWQKLPTDYGNPLYGVSSGSPNDVFAVGGYGIILHYEGGSWSAMDSGVEKNLYGVWGGTGSGVFAVGASGTILCYHPPQLQQISLSQAYQRDQYDVVLRGYGLNEVTALDFGDGITVSNIVHANDTELTASINVTADAATGQRDLRAQRARQILELKNALEILPTPLLASGLKPDSGIQGTNITIRISGDYFTDDIKLDFGSGITVDNVNVISRELIETELEISPSANMGSRDIVFTRGDEALTLPEAFTVKLPPMTVSDITPRSAEPGQEVTVNISGEHLDRITGIDFGAGITVIGYQVDSAALITATILVANETPPADREIRLLGNEETLSLPEGFSVIEPSLPTTDPEEEIIKADRRDPIAFIGVGVGVAVLGSLLFILRRQVKAYRPPEED